MTKTKEELDQLKQECETLTNKLKELTEEELQQVVGGDSIYSSLTEVTEEGGNTNSVLGIVRRKCF